MSYMRVSTDEIVKINRIFKVVILLKKHLELL